MSWRLGSASWLLSVQRAGAGTLPSRPAWISRLKHQYWRDLWLYRRYHDPDPTVDELLCRRWVLATHEWYQRSVGVTT